MNVGIVGCGLIGQKRAGALAGARLVACADVSFDRAQALAARHAGAAALADWRKLVALPEVEIVVVATPHDQLPAVTLGAVQAGKHVLVEKPAARGADELDPVIAAARAAGVRVRVGFNHRYHPSFLRMQKIVASGEVGELMFVRARYGHGGRLGYEKEWRAAKAISGGGEMIDQGMHLIDLARLFLGEFAQARGSVPTYFWNMPVEDNGFMLLETAKRQVAFLHASWTEWRNTFSFELYGRTAKLEVTGLGGSYGDERLAYYKMSPAMGPPETTIWEFRGADTSWETEFREFLDDIRLEREPAAGLADARAALDVVGRIYREQGR
jgi:predicted dehydrogenase